MTPKMMQPALAVGSQVRCSMDADLTYNDGVTIDRVSGVSVLIPPDCWCRLNSVVSEISGRPDASEPKVRPSR